MKTLQLEVGKTYRSRAGEEVKIVRKNNKGWPYWEGSNGGWYYEGGKGSFAAEEHPKDLIEEVTIPDVNQKHNEMKTLKLQVGKTYRSRKGEEVKIIGTKDSMWPFVGDNEESYDEQGRYYSANSDSPDDLIEEVPEPTRHTFDIPDGVKKVTVEQVGNRIVVEMVPKEDKGPKPGDVMVNKYGDVYILKSVADNGGLHYHSAWLGKDGFLSTGGACYAGRPATPEEAQPLWDALKKAGKRWNPEAMQVEDVPEKEQIDKFLEGYAKGVRWSHKQLRWLIEDYLKTQGGQKNETRRP